MKLNKLLPLLLTGGILANLLSGCAVTVATVAGVAAYSLSQSTADSQHLTKLLNEQIQNSNLVTTILDKNLILAGQVNSESSINQARILIAKQDDQMTVYSYAQVAQIETQSERYQDTELSQQVNSLLSRGKLKGNAVVSNKTAYVLFDNKTPSEDINHMTKNILSIPDIKSIIFVKP